MENPTITTAQADQWTKIVSGGTSFVITILKSPYSNVFTTYRIEGGVSPTIEDPENASFEGKLFKTRSKQVKSPHTIDYYILPEGGSCTIRIDNGIGGASLVKQNSLLLNRPLSATGLPPVGAASSSDILITGDGSSTPIDYYIEALDGECLACARAIVQVIAATDISTGEYGDQTALTNGIQVFYKRSGVTLDVTNGLPVKTNEHWGRWCYDSRPAVIGPTQNSPSWSSRWSFTKYGHPYGVVLEEGDQLGLRIRDNLTGLSEHTVIIQGIHLGTPNSSWTKTL